MSADYNCGDSMFGGNLADIPQPHVRWFDNQTLRRKIKVTVNRYRCAGATHYYVDFDIEGDPVWNEKEQKWQTSWDDPTAHSTGFGRARKFSNVLFAGNFIRRVLRRFFPTDKWIHDVSNIYVPEHEERFFYAREGD